MAPQSDLAEAARRPARAARRPPRWRGAVRLAVLVGVLGALAWSLATQRASVRPLLGQLSVRSLAAALAAVLAGILATFLCWRAVLADLGGRLPVVAGARVFFLGQLGKYLPGSVWPVIAQMELGRDYDVPERASGAAVGAFLLVVVGTGLAVAAVTAPLLGPDALHSYWWLLAVLPVALVAIVPPVLNRLLGVALRLVRRPPLPAPLSNGGVLRAAGWADLDAGRPVRAARRPAADPPGDRGVRGRLVRRLPAGGRPCRGGRPRGRAGPAAGRGAGPAGGHRGRGGVAAAVRAR